MGRRILEIVLVGIEKVVEEILLWPGFGGIRVVTIVVFVVSVLKIAFSRLPLFPEGVRRATCEHRDVFHLTDCSFLRRELGAEVADLIQKRWER